MKRALPTIVAALCCLAFAGLVRAEREGADTRPSIIEPQAGSQADTGRTPVKKFGKKGKKGGKIKKRVNGAGSDLDAGIGATDTGSSGESGMQQRSVLLPTPSGRSAFVPVGVTAQ